MDGLRAAKMLLCIGRARTVSVFDMSMHWKNLLVGFWYWGRQRLGQCNASLYCVERSQPFLGGVWASEFCFYQGWGRLHLPIWKRT